MAEKYCFTIGNEGQESLNLLEKIFNDQTKYFLSRHGLKSGLSILDIGCGLGHISQTDMKCVDASIYQPILIEPNVRQLLLQNECIECLATPRQFYKFVWF